MGTSKRARRDAGVVRGRHRLGRAVGVALALAGLIGPAGCAGAAQAWSRLPARPAELRLDGVDPCALLTEAQTRQLGVRPGQPTGQNDRLGAAGCRWTNLRGEAPVSYLARPILDQGADVMLPGSAGATSGDVVTIDGFSAVRTAAPMVDPRNHCVLMVDVARGQSLWVQWLTLSPSHPDLTHELACQKAGAAARLILANLRNLSR